MRNRGDVHERSGLLLKRFLHCKLPEAVSFDLRREQSFEELTNDIYWKKKFFFIVKSYNKGSNLMVRYKHKVVTIHYFS